MIILKISIELKISVQIPFGLKNYLELCNKDINGDTTCTGIC